MRRILLGLVLSGACVFAPPAAAQAAQASSTAKLPPVFRAQGSVQVAFSPWDNAEGMVVDAIRQAKTQILVQAFSFTSRALANALMAAKRRGVDVLVLADREQTFNSEAGRIPELAQAGIAVMLEVRYQSAHNKVIVIDADTEDAAVITGSYNWTYAAQFKNAENVLILRNTPDIANAYAANWRRHYADSLPYIEP